MVVKRKTIPSQPAQFRNINRDHGERSNVKDLSPEPFALKLN